MEQPEFLRIAKQVLDRLEIPWMVVGSYATSIWGEARYTNDIDIVVDLALDSVPQLCGSFPHDEFYVSESAAREAIRFRKQFNVLHPASGNKIDFMIARSDEWGRLQLTRRRFGLAGPDFEIPIAAPEDTIISKMRYYREGGSDKHLRDSAGVLAVQREHIDRAYIDHWAEHFHVMDVWLAIQRRVKEVHGF